MVYYCKAPITLKLTDYTPNQPHLDYTRIPHLVRMFKYWLKKQKDKFDSSVGNKLSLHSEPENEFRFETYLDLIKNVKTRVAVTKMRISCHLLPIESGSYKRILELRDFAPFVRDPKSEMNSTIC